MTLKDLRGIIQNLPGVSAWELRQIHKKGFQRYLVFDQIDSQRIVEKVSYLATLYTLFDQGGKKVLGESTVVLSEGDHPRARLISALEMASLVANPVFELPGKGLSYDQVKTADPAIKADPLACLDQIQDDFIKAPLEKVKRSSAEIFVEEKEILLLNSKGLELEKSETDIRVEFVLLAEKGSQLEGESQGIKKTRFYENLNLPGMVQQYAQYARETLAARLPQGGTYPVLFSEESLDTLFGYFCLQASGPAQYQHWTQCALGESVIKDPKGDLLSLNSNPSLNGATQSGSFDPNGLPLHRVEVIQDNVFQRRMNSKRYADYLQEEATGAFTNIEVKTGTRSFRTLSEEGPCYHLLRFSTFEPNSITGTFSGEIRTGYFISRGERIPIKGGSVSGVMQEAFKEAFFSREKTQRAAYLGPEAVRIERLAMAGS